MDNEFEIGERLPAETRIEIPELSNAREVLLTPIPFENRVAFLSEYERSLSKSLTLSEIARQLHRQRSTIASMADAVGATSTYDEKLKDTLYEVFTLEVLRDEQEWYRQYENLDKFLSSTDIAEVIIRDERWVVNIANELEVYPQITTRNNGQTFAAYPKSLAIHTREYILHYPPSDGWVTATSMAVLFNRSYRWIVKNAEQQGFIPQLRTHADTHEILPHYSQEVISALSAVIESLPPPAEDWVTAAKISSEIKKSRRWVDEKILDYDKYSEVRLGHNNVPHVHYPPEILIFLDKVAAEEPIPIFGWDTPSGIANSVNMNIFRVIKLLKEYHDQSKMLPDVTNRLVLHYPPSVIEEISRMATELPPPAGSWLTLNEIALMLRKHRNWTQRSITELKVNSEMRLDRSGKVRIHYPENTVDLLQRHFLIDEDNSSEV
jgi:hypothetical protein